MTEYNLQGEIKVAMYVKKENFKPQNWIWSLQFHESNLMLDMYER